MEYQQHTSKWILFVKIIEIWNEIFTSQEQSISYSTLHPPNILLIWVMPRWRRISDLTCFQTPQCWKRFLTAHQIHLNTGDVTSSHACKWSRNIKPLNETHLNPCQSSALFQIHPQRPLLSVRVTCAFGKKTSPTHRPTHSQVQVINRFPINYCQSTNQDGKERFIIVMKNISCCEPIGKGRRGSAPLRCLIRLQGWGALICKWNRGNYTPPWICGN